MPIPNSLRHVCLALMLMLPLSAFASQKGQNAFIEKDMESGGFFSQSGKIENRVPWRSAASARILSSGLALETPTPADSIRVRENAQEMKKRALQGDQWLGGDKFKHFGVSVILTVSVKVLADNLLDFDREPATFSAAGLTFLCGFGKELYDDTYPNNIFSLKDLLADLAGVLLGVLLVQLF